MSVLSLVARHQSLQDTRGLAADHGMLSGATGSPWCRHNMHSPLVAWAEADAKLLKKP